MLKRHNRKTLYKNSRPKIVASVNDESIKLESGWKEALRSEFDKDYMQFIREFLGKKIKQGALIYPEPKNIFRAFNETPFNEVRVVLLGQDPYHGPLQANGLCFSVDQGITIPPSLANIFKELESDLKIPRPKSGDLTPWARQGVLLLNSVLTVEAGKAGSHQMLNWEKFTDEAIKQLSDRRRGLVFVLWGGYALTKQPLIDQEKHYVISGPHPSPLSAYRGFLGSKPFSRVNELLVQSSQAPIDWQLPT